MDAEERVTELSLLLDDQEDKGRRHNLQIRGMPEADGREDLFKILQRTFSPNAGSRRWRDSLSPIEVPNWLVPLSYPTHRARPGGRRGRRAALADDEGPELRQ